MSDLYRKALNKWGIKCQRWVLLEEMGEVMQAFSHEKRKRCDDLHVLNELIDMQIALNSVKLHYANGYEWDAKIEFAEERLRQRISDYDKGLRMMELKGMIK